MNKRYRSFIGLLLILMFILMAGMGCGSPETEPSSDSGLTMTPTTPSPTPAPGTTQSDENQAPVVSLSAAATQVAPSSVVGLTLTTSDPDGDPISYEWSATGGQLSGAVPTISWIAPEHYGDFDITVTAKDGKGGITQASVTVTVIENLEPAITSVTAEQTSLLPLDRTTITCVATDPDGDPLSYKWEADLGEITGVGDTITWIAPDIEGTYSISVVIDDGKGGTDIAGVSIIVTRTEMMKTFTPIPQETGSVSTEGDKDTSRTWAGDDDENIGYCAYWSFNLYELRGTDVKEATLEFTDKFMERDPFMIKQGEGLSGLKLWQVDYEAGKLPGFTIDEEDILKELKVDGDRDFWSSPPVSVDITDIVAKIGIGTSSRDTFKLRAGFVRPTNGTSFAEWLEWQKVVLVVSYENK